MQSEKSKRDKNCGVVGKIEKKNCRLLQTYSSTKNHRTIAPASRGASCQQLTLYIVGSERMIILIIDYSTVPMTGSTFHLSNYICLLRPCAYEYLIYVVISATLGLQDDQVNQYYQQLNNHFKVTSNYSMINDEF